MAEGCRRGCGGIGLQLLSSPDHIALNKNEPALMQALNDAVSKMEADGSLNKISLEWLQKPLDPKDLTE